MDYKIKENVRQQRRKIIIEAYKTYQEKKKGKNGLINQFLVRRKIYIITITQPKLIFKNKNISYSFSFISSLKTMFLSLSLYF